MQPQEKTSSSQHCVSRTDPDARRAKISKHLAQNSEYAVVMSSGAAIALTPYAHEGETARIRITLAETPGSSFDRTGSNLSQKNALPPFSCSRTQPRRFMATAEGLFF
jgi:hypothetical protein